MPYILLLFLWCAAIAPVQAASPATQSALEFAEKRNWAEAMRQARHSDRPELIALVQWRAMLDKDSGADFDEIIQFMENHRNWPYQSLLQQRAEFALRSGFYDESRLLRFFDTHDPITGIGKITLAGALSKLSPDQSERIHTLIHQGWIHGDFDRTMESYIRTQYANILTVDDHMARIDRLLWDRQTRAAERMLPYIPASRRALYEARIALVQHSRRAAYLLRKVPSSQQDNQGLIFDRIRYKAKRKDDAGVREMLEQVPKSEQNPDLWWVYRNQQAREAINRKHYKTAASLVTDYDNLTSADLAEALWLEGWLALEYNDRPSEALQLFERMHGAVSYPVSLARAAYWAGRAASKSGKRSSAENWYEKAATHPTTFYGQLAAIALQELPDLPRERMPEAESPHNLLERAIYLCIETGDYDIATQLISHAIATADDDDDIARIAAIGHHEGVPHLSVRAGKKALQEHLVIPAVSHPRPQIAADIPIERALMLAIIRQESEFDREAKSSAGAVGMMQLLPSTARHVARKTGLPYSRSRLYTTEYNVTLGSHYLLRLIDAYGGSYVLAIAAYNAGPGNVSKWIKLFGRPGNRPDDVINWIEHIPFTETRNYVQRVLENLQVYRRLEQPDGYRLNMLEEDLLR